MSEIGGGEIIQRRMEAAGSVGADPDPLTDDNRYVGSHRHTIAECVRCIEERGYRVEARAQGGPSLDVERIADAIPPFFIDLGTREARMALAVHIAARLAPADPVEET